MDTPDDLWGVNDRVSYSLIQSEKVQISQSLYLVKVDNLNFHKNQYGKRRASFSYNNIAYDLAVTDPKFDNILTNSLEVSGVICISLGEPFYLNSWDDGK